MIHTVMIEGVRWVCDMRPSLTWVEEYDMRIYNADKSVWIAHADHKHNVPVYSNDMRKYIQKIVEANT